VSKLGTNEDREKFKEIFQDFLTRLQLYLRYQAAITRQYDRRTRAAN
jgi:hypothetical protein